MIQEVGISNATQNSALLSLVSDYSWASDAFVLRSLLVPLNYRSIFVCDVVSNLLKQADWSDFLGAAFLSLW